jgi:hypothetical protein
LRGGAGFDYRGNDQYLASVFDLPAAQLGFAVARDDVAFHLGTFAGYAATARFDAGPGTERNLDGAVTWGGFADARGFALPFFMRTELRYFGAPSSATGAPLQWMGRACFMIEAVVTCLDGSSMRGRVKLADEPTYVDAAIGYVGVSLGVGGTLASR